MAANIIESFFVSLGFEINTEKIEEFKKKTDELRESAVTIGAMFTGAAAGIGLLVQGVAASMGDIASFAELNDISAKSVAALGKIAVENDGSLEGMKSTIQSMNKTIGEAAIGIGRGAMTFEKLGLSAKFADGRVKTVDDLLGEVADKMQGLSRQEQIAMAEKLGIDPQFVKVLEKGSENLAKLREEAELLNPFTEEDYQLADQVDKLFIKAKGTLGTFTKMLGVSLLPTVKEVLKNYLEWFKASRKATSDVFVRALKAIAGAIGTVWDWVVRLVTVLKDVFDWLTRFKVVIWAAGVAIAAIIAYQAGVFFTSLGAAIFTAVRALLSFNVAASIPIILIGGIVIAIALLVDELVNFYEGNETIIGQLNDDYPGAIYGAWAALSLLIGGFVAMKWQAISAVASTIASVATLAAGWIASFASMAVATIAATWPILLIIAAVAAVVGAIWYLWANWDQVVALLSGAWETVKTALSNAFENVMSVFDAAKQKVMGFIDSVMGAIGKVGQLLGLTNDASKVSVAVNSGGGSSAQASGNNSLNSAGGVIGTAGSNVGNSSNVSNTTQISGTTINVNSPDPAKAGEAVKNELDRMNKQAVRNGQTAVAL